ncbi:MAG: asparagine synthase (glutamine-hydrolyzing) [Opitutaceae bacterium]|nr:asparagine synthase (glutamine-hydrolyzing) [Opitutaceae bacterium]
MCGICGIYHQDGAPASRDTLTAMSTSMSHRGPDGSGHFLDREVGLGHRRLSIIDLEGGGQPIGNEDGSLQVVFNGEIYNFVELRQELEAAGHRFSTHSDTEVIVHGYEQWGRDCVSRFNGMFAFAIWDTHNRELFIARDHLGIKPLYYTQLGSTLLFASEIKAILAYPGIQRAVDLDALAQLFTFRYVPSPLTLFKGILKLPPGHWMHAGAGRVTIERFWRTRPIVNTARSEADIIAEYQDLLKDAIRIQLRSDVPLGLFLSSGIDSGVILAIMREFSSSPVQAFTIGFDGGEKTNEVDDARAMAKMFGADHMFQMIGPADYARYYERYMNDLEEPVGNETAAAFYFVSHITSKKVKVALTGQGADEPWAGYGRHRGAKLSGTYSRLPAPVTWALREAISRIPGRAERIKRGVLSLDEADMLTRFAKIYSFFSADMKARLFTGKLKADLDADPFHTRHALARLQKDVADLDPLTQMLYVDTRSNLPDDLLMVGDKTSMACSLEVRVPFLDYRLVEFIETLPPSMKLRGMNGKYLHKKACEKWLPKEVVYRKKKGFANPVEHWFRVGMKDFVDDHLLGSGAAIHQYFDVNYIAEILKADRSGTEQYRRQIYLLLSLELWHRSFFRRD